MAKKAAKKTAKKSAKKVAYTKPELREKIKAKVTKGVKGGRPGQWSARKAQLVATKYEAEGGGYTGERDDDQKSLKKWGDEKWHTSDGKPAIRGKKKTTRYLPDKAWDKLTPAEKTATDQKKVAGAEKGKQFVKNTKKAATSGKRVRARKS